MRANIIAAFVVFGVAAPGVAVAQSEPAEPIDITQTTCRDLLLAPGDEETHIMIYFQGYVSGKRGETTADVDALSVAAGAVMSACVDDPSAKLLDVLLAKR